MRNIEKISPIKRQEIIDLLNSDAIKYFSSIKVFGSAITNTCTKNSDIDLFVTLKPEYMNSVNESYNALMLATESEKDIFYSHEQHGLFNQKLYEKMKNGVEIL